MCVEVLFLFWTSRTLQLGFLEIIPLLPRNSSVTNVNMWQPLRRGWDNTFGWSTRRFFGALTSQEGHWIALPLCCRTQGKNSARIVKPPSQLDTSVRIVSALNLNKNLMKKKLQNNVENVFQSLHCAYALNISARNVVLKQIISSEFTVTDEHTIVT